MASKKKARGKNLKSAKKLQHTKSLSMADARGKPY